ncbi:Dps family protein [Paraburkholderia xenovorans]|uniref:Dps family protein n=1 Tax=Paraburkholderia xenovorans TaxID=36873 RepID=UPI0038BB9A6C
MNQILADTMTLLDMYKKHHRQVVGPTFQSLHLLHDAHCDKQVELVETLAERIQLLGGVSIAMAAHVAEMTMVPRPSRAREEVPVQLSRLLEAHEIVMVATRSAASKANELCDFGTKDVLVKRRIAHERVAGLVPRGAPDRRASRGHGMALIRRCALAIGR